MEICNSLEASDIEDVKEELNIFRIDALAAGSAGACIHGCWTENARGFFSSAILYVRLDPTHD